MLLGYCYWLVKYQYLSSLLIEVSHMYFIIFIIEISTVFIYTLVVGWLQYHHYYETYDAPQLLYHYEHQ